MLEDKKHLAVRKKSFKDLLNKAGRRRRDRRIALAALQRPCMSSFEVLFGRGCDQSLITLTGFDHKAFRYILSLFEPVFASHTPYSESGAIKRLPSAEKKTGRPRSLSARNCLGLVLSWGRARGSGMISSLLFGISGSACSFFILFGRRMLDKVLSKDKNAAVRMSTEDEIPVLQNAVQAKYSILSNVYAMADGLKLYLEKAGHCRIQNMFYNG